MNRIKQDIVWAINRTTIAWDSLKVTVKLGVREVPLRLSGTCDDLKRGLNPRRAVHVIVMTALVVTPTALYFVERLTHKAKQRAYDALTFEAAAEQTFLATSLRDLLQEQARLTSMLLDAGYTVRSGDNVTVKVVATGYSSTIQETDDTPFVTASNTRTRRGVLALSRDLLKRYTADAPFDFGDRVHLSGLGNFIVEDSMNRRWDNRIDLWFASSAEARKFGIREVYMSLVEPQATGSTPRSAAGAVAASGF
jgi:3D (Asp-Asp-Asp) domain-containing protein